MMENLGRRLRPHEQEPTERNEVPKGLRWYHKALVIPVLALAIFAASLTTPDQARADHENYWGQCFTAYGTTWYGLCWIGVDHATGQHYELGYGYWQTSDIFVYQWHNDPCNEYVWIRGGGWSGPWPEDYCRTF